MMICWAFLDKNKVVAESWNNLEEVPVPSVTSQKNCVPNGEKISVRRPNILHNVGPTRFSYGSGPKKKSTRIEENVLSR